MIRASDIRVWTALGVIGLSCLAVRQAFDVAAFGWNATLVNEDNASGRMTPYQNVSSVGYLARITLARLVPDDDAAERVAEAADLLARVPVLSDAWLQYSRAQFAAGGPPAKVAAALALSSLTGPNEAWVAARRVSFALPIWTTLPPGSRRSVISDLAGSGYDNMDEANRFALKVSLRAASPKMREEVRAALLLANKRGDELVRTFGLGRTLTRDTVSSPEKGNEAGGAPGTPTSARASPSLPNGAFSPEPIAPPVSLRSTAQ